jgi:hypothetical protein
MELRRANSKKPGIGRASSRKLPTHPLGRELMNAQPWTYGRKLDECEVVGSELVVACCDPTTEAINPL